MELMSALDHALGERWTAGRKTLESIVRAATVQISARAEGTDGTVVMTPKNGLLREGEQVEIDAYPNAGYAFLDWRKPNGSLAGLASRLIVHGGMPVGRYTARFKKRSQCSPPELLSPTEATISMRISAPIVRYTIRVSDACRPVSFRANSKLPFGFNLDSGTGVISGTPHFLGTNTVTIAVIGNDLKRTEKTVQLTIIVDDDESSDDTAESVD